MILITLTEKQAKLLTATITDYINIAVDNCTELDELTNGELHALEIKIENQVKAQTGGQSVAKCFNTYCSNTFEINLRDGRSRRRQFCDNNGCRQKICRERKKKRARK